VDFFFKKKNSHNNVTLPRCGDPLGLQVRVITSGRVEMCYVYITINKKNKPPDDDESGQGYTVLHLNQRGADNETGGG